MDGAAQYLLAGLARVDREHRKSLGKQIFQHEIARPHVVGRGADHGDGLHRVQNAGDVAVVVGVVIHGLSSYSASARRAAGSLQKSRIMRK